MIIEKGLYLYGYRPFLLNFLLKWGRELMIFLYLYFT